MVAWGNNEHGQPEIALEGKTAIDVAAGFTTRSRCWRRMSGVGDARAIPIRNRRLE